MLFNSFEFFIFFPIVTILYFVLPYRVRWALLLGASYFFYMAWKPEFIVLILISTIIDYFASLKMDGCSEKSQKKKFLYLSLISNLGMLFYFKYFYFFKSSIFEISSVMNGGFLSGAEKIIIPMGISFYTFQTLSYTIDVYKGKRKAEKHFGIFALYVTFFPQLVAGPIERSEKLLPQFYEKHDFDYEHVTSGLRRILWGLFKKMVIADNISVLVQAVYDNPRDYYGVPLILATLSFAVLIYCDFSGYSDIAIGSARVLGFDLMENFKMPYFSKSISQFWNRWHISLSSWFRDYVYIPLGGNRVAVPRGYFNLFITFMVSGLWHGANWTFVIWGALNGIYLILERVLREPLKKVSKKMKLYKMPKTTEQFKRIGTFALVCYGWVFFKANSLSDAMYITKNMFKGLGNIKELGYIKKLLLTDMGVTKEKLVVIILSVGVLFIWQFISKRDDAIESLKGKNVVLRWGVYYLIIMSIIFFGVFTKQNFIYFQF